MENPSAPFAKVRPYANLLVECKQSELPYIFFLRDRPASLTYEFPEIGGLLSTDLALFSETDEGISHQPFTMSLHDTFGFWEFPFFGIPCPLAISLAKTAYKSGGTLELTGEDAYRSLTLPLMKAADHLKQISQPRSESESFAFRLILCVAVLRAPMFGVHRQEDEDVIFPLPWIRVSRLEPWRSGLPFRTTSNVRYYDVVHEDYLPEYIGSFLRDATNLADRITNASDVIAAGRGASRLDDKTTYTTLRLLTSEDEVPSESKPKYRIARIDT